MNFLGVNINIKNSPELAEKIHVALPDEKFRRVGQSAIAASLPEIR